MSKSTKKTSKISSKKAPKKSPGKSARAKAKKIDPKFDEKTSLDTAYLTNNSDGAVTLEIILGAAGQTGVTDIILDSINIITGENGSIPEFALGTNKKLSGKTMHITTVVSDTAKNTNYLESIIRLRGGIRFSEYTLYKTVPKEGDNAIFTAAIEFFKI
jgi:hypothetical protein